MVFYSMLAWAVLSVCIPWRSESGLSSDPYCQLHSGVRIPEWVGSTVWAAGETPGQAKVDVDFDPIAPRNILKYECVFPTWLSP